MGKTTGFMEYSRKANSMLCVQQRILNFDEFYVYNKQDERKKQAARCMNCGVPFCGSAIELAGMVTGCPLHNLIPEWNDEIYNGNYAHALARLLKTNCFPEFTGRVCPSLCEKACINGMYGDAVTIHDNELFLIENGFSEGYMRPNPPKARSDKRIAVVGSGPAGLAVAEKLNKRGHSVTVFERDDAFGGLLMYGIPNMKLSKNVVRRRIELMQAEGVRFEAQKDLGRNMQLAELEKDFDAVVLCCGAKKARDIEAKGRDAAGVHFAVDYLTAATKALMQNSADEISAGGRHVIVLGGGDTGNDCVGTAIRQGAKSVLQLEIMPKPPQKRTKDNPWPQWPRVFTADYGQQEAAEVFGSDPRVFQTTIKEIHKEKGKVSALTTVKVEFKGGKLCEVAGSEATIKADMLLIAAGFTGSEQYMAQGLTLPSPKGAEYKTSRQSVFACGDMKRGQSLVVWAIAEGIKCAKEVDEFLNN